MSIHVALYHRTHYRYDRPVGHAPHIVRLRPAPHARTRILSYAQRIVGGEHFINWQQDPFSNWNARLTFLEPLRELAVEVELVAEMATINPFDFFVDPAAFHFPFAYEPGLRHDLGPFLAHDPVTPRLGSLLDTVRTELLKHPERLQDSHVPESEHRPDIHHDGGQLPAVAVGVSRSKTWEEVRTIDFLVALNQRLFQLVRYVIRMEPGVQTPEETLTLGTGSCRDSAWLLVSVLRHLGLAARFASGYLIQLVPDTAPLDGPKGPENDFTDLHAWCEVYLPGAGWVGLDPTSGLLAGEGHIPLSCTPDPASAAPVTGAVDPCEVTMEHEMRVHRVYEAPRVTKPYSDSTWTQIMSLGRALDVALEKDDVRLTMGGEPTFVSTDDPDGPEWNFTALSPAKRNLAAELLLRLQQRFAPGALRHYGTGKWYPGESLPRWSLTCYWRKDGRPVWRNPALIADERRNYGFGSAEAATLIRTIAEMLGVDPECIRAGYEDVFYYAWKERRLPFNVTPEQSRLKEPEERARIARVFERQLGSVVGWALPLARDQQDPTRWTSGPWFLRSEEHLWLIPGDSPMGLRLPLDSLPWVEAREYPQLHPVDPMAPRAALPDPSHWQQRWVRTGSERRADAPANLEWQRATEALARRPRMQESASWIVRTALCVEPREGRLYVFLPPVATLEDYLEMVSGIEQAVQRCGWPVVIEGEPPPKDSRIARLGVTPDPGVIEVNLHPSQSWAELVAKTEGLYEDARLTRLAAEKFMMDGRHTGTGGGNHLILGGETPADSPMLRRPDLLRSLLAYWQNHPSLSWVFSGLFVGPTSQAPRVDEARHDSLHELEIAFQELDRQVAGPAGSGEGTGWVPPWLVDRVFRHLLVDSTGNTHRTEFCIDKLYAPESASGRLGLLEMRAFEMPPHPRMSLVQQLLLRGLVATFWKKPYRRGLVRWGTEIHDRWLLPHYCETDFREVLQDLQEAGFPFDFAWFVPHFEFKFPRIGEFAQRDIRVDLRMAIEPWHVLGEEPGPGGTVRCVDSSLERLQVKVQGWDGGRFQVLCNGHPLPLHPTGTRGEAVAGVRYRAWQPPSCLQPTIGVHSPLIFDLYDTWNDRSLGGCTYHVSHPGGRSYHSLPVNAYEAESRRRSRFFTDGRLVGPPAANPGRVLPDFPMTLDLRCV